MHTNRKIIFSLFNPFALKNLPFSGIGERYIHQVQTNRSPASADDTEKYAKEVLI